MDSATGKQKVFVVFAYWQELGDLPPYPAFNVHEAFNKDHPRTVDLETLLQMGLPVPAYPAYEDWKEQDEFRKNWVNDATQGFIHLANLIKWTTRYEPAHTEPAEVSDDDELQAAG